MPTDNAVSTVAKPATPLPWRQGNNPKTGDVIYGPKNTAAECFLGSSEGVQDAAYIVEACNAYPRLLAERAELVEALRRAIETEEKGWIDDSEPQWIMGSRALLSRIGGGK